VVDQFDDYYGWLHDEPKNLRKDLDNVMEMDVLGGFAKDDGASILNKNCKR